MKDLKFGLIFSAAFHGTLVAAGTIGIPALLGDEPEMLDPISVQILTVDELDRIKEKQKSTEQKIVRTAVGRSEYIRSRETISENDAVPLPDAVIKDKPAPPRQAEVRPPAPVFTPRDKPRPPDKLDASRIAALIDRSIMDQPQAVDSRDFDQTLEDAVAATRLTALEARRATATLQTIIRQRVELCWSIPAGAKQAEDLNVRLKIYLTQDGTLARPPVFLDKERMMEPGQEFFRAAAESAARAIRRCAPYDLPRDKYDLWRVIEFHFDPREMLGG